MYGSLYASFLAQTPSPIPNEGAAAAPATFVQGLTTLGIIFAIFVLPFILGRIFSRFLKMPTHSSKIGLVIAATVASALVLAMVPLRYGPDIKGGTNLVYELDQSANTLGSDKNKSKVTAADLIPKLTQRLNPSGTKEIIIRPNGSKQIEIVVPNIDQQEVAEIKRIIQNAGVLQFRIVANSTDHEDIKQLAQKQSTSESESERLSKEVRSSDGSRVVGIWQFVGRDERQRDGLNPLKVENIHLDILRDAKTGQIIKGLNYDNSKKYAFERALIAKGITDVEVLLALERRGNRFDLVTGEDLDVVRKGFGKDGSPEVEFTMKSSGANRLSSLTYANRPDGEFHRKMAIVLDGRVLSAPNLNNAITSQGVIQGNFTNEECEYLESILKSGALPAALNKQPVSENIVGAATGQDAINKGFNASILSLIVTFVLIVLYYRFSGVIACLAMVINVAMIFAAMVLIQQPLTLPGLAGLVLSVGMSVDANVLVFERIREEIAKRSTGRLAIRNGFDRAWTTIIDSNLTTLISALVLYWMGSDQVKGFAITLIIGLIVSMFTAVFCSHVFFEIAEKLRIANFSMSDGVIKLKNAVFGKRDLDFMSMRYLCYAVSLVLIVIGLVATAIRGRQILDIDFNGGTSVTFALNKPIETDKVREMIDTIFTDDKNGLPIQTSLTNVQMNQFAPNTVFKLDTSLTDVNDLASRLVSGITEATAGSTLVTYRVVATPPTEVVSDTPAPPPEGSEPPAEALAKPTRTKRTLTFSTSNDIDSAKIAGTTLTESLVLAAKAAGIILVDSQADIYPKDVTEWNRDSQVGYAAWNVTLPVNAEDNEKIIDEMSNELSLQPVWQSMSSIEGRVAGEMQRDAIVALIVSLIFITAYIWFRFQKVSYGLAAVLALLHDVFITLAFIAVSHWLFRPLSFLLLEDFKISLTIVAAFLTIIGYSLNDTIVVFDRIREVKGKSPRLTSAMVNQSINQTLSRTLLTSSTTIFAVMLLYVFGGEALHGFSFTLLIGIVVGTFSSIFIASPIMLWLSDREQTVSRIGSK